MHKIVIIIIKSDLYNRFTANAARAHCVAPPPTTSVLDIIMYFRSTAHAHALHMYYSCCCWENQTRKCNRANTDVGEWRRGGRNDGWTMMMMMMTMRLRNVNEGLARFGGIRWKRVNKWPAENADDPFLFSRR